jgi:hypothetical protein
LDIKEQAIMDFLHQRVFDPILQSPMASERLKQGTRLTIMRMEQRDASGLIQNIRPRRIDGNRDNVVAIVVSHPGVMNTERRPSRGA